MTSHRSGSGDDPSGVVADWHELTVDERRARAIRVVLVGAESTGKTTLVRRLCEHLRTRGPGTRRMGDRGRRRADSVESGWADSTWVPEVGRQYTLDRLAELRHAATVAGEPPPTVDDLTWTSPHFVAIANAQNAEEDAAAGRGGPVLICDTDAFATGIWHERYCDATSPEVDRLARHHPLYLVPHPDDVPFTQDGIRDGEHLRRWMHDRFVERLSATGRPFVVLRGDRAAFEHHAIEAIASVVPQRLRE